MARKRRSGAVGADRSPPRGRIATDPGSRLSQPTRVRVLRELVGHGIASKLSARLGEGVLNGLLTARVGLSALAVCRPAPFGAVKPPGVSDVAPFLFGGGK